jgi:hypothetical protein
MERHESDRTADGRDVKRSMKLARKLMRLSIQAFLTWQKDFVVVHILG